MAGLDKCAKALRNHYGISYTEGLRVKAEVTKSPTFEAKWAEAKALGTSFTDLVLKLAGPIIQRDFEDIPDP